MTERVGDIGEFGLIARLRAGLPQPEDGRLVLGTGDDAAAWRIGEGYGLATTDTMVAGVHFLPDVATWHDVGWKALAVNVSDIAAMGGQPAYALVTLCLPPETPLSAVDDLYVGLRECAEDYGVTVAGGDIVSSPVFSVTVALYGEAQALLRRDGARPGDVIAVTAPLGASSAGLRLLQEGFRPDALNDPRDVLVEAHMHPWPRIDAGGFAVEAGIRCGIDISDGLLQDLGHICRASGVDAAVRFDRIPVEEHARNVYPDDAAMLAATGGEDYELILVGPAARIAHADKRLTDYLGTGAAHELHIIGEMVDEGEGRVRVLDADAREMAIEAGGWDHLREHGA